MKKLALSIAALFLILSGCGQQDAKQPDTEKGTGGQTAQSVQKNEKDTDRNDIKKKENSKDTMAQLVQTAEKPVPQYRLNPATWSLKPITKANPKAILLTFDDSPDKYALDIAKTLQSLHVKAIFFVNGHFLESAEGRKKLKAIHDMGFMIGNHTYHHTGLKDLPEAKQKDEIVKLNNLVKSITGEQPKFFRAPFGQNTDYSKKIAAQQKMILMNWSFGYDWVKEYQSKAAITKIMLTTPYLTSGANLLMHDRKWTSEAIKDIVQGYQAMGYDIIDPALIETL
ncbi:polysaccharide deacetylase family protein [Peribacillus sp. B-H-3]|uniref:polysaccharide deacetylase family protein n=1 Tax=Peribacillus sp. B-H-3 TaxID=3400420 RepID=UPI003B01615B